MKKTDWSEPLRERVPQEYFQPLLILSMTFIHKAMFTRLRIRYFERLN